MRDNSRMTDEDHLEAEILIGGMTREEFLGEPERIDFLQPPRPTATRPDEG